MKIFFDVSTLNPDKITGVGVYMLQLLRHMSAKVTVVPVLKISRIKNRKKIESLLPQKHCEVVLPWKFATGANSIYHGPDFKLNVKGGFPRVVTIHDMVVFEQKYNAEEFYQKGMAEMSSVLNGPLDGVIVNSKFTQSEVLKYFPHLKDKIHLTYLGCDREPNPPGNAAVQKMDLPEKYILFLGTLEKRKNVIGAIKAFEKLKAHHAIPHKLVLGGRWGFGSEVIKEVLKNSPVSKDIIHLSYVPSENLIEVYQKASVFFFPSFYEGFGIPALEAMALGCPVVVSSGGALEEVCGDAALSAPPEDYAALADVLAQVLTRDDVAEDLRVKGRARAQKFTWAQCAEDTLQVYKKVLNKSL